MCDHSVCVCVWKSGSVGLDVWCLITFCQRTQGCVRADESLLSRVGFYYGQKTCQQKSNSKCISSPRAKSLNFGPCSRQTNPLVTHWLTHYYVLYSWFFFFFFLMFSKCLGEFWLVCVSGGGSLFTPVDLICLSEGLYHWLCGSDD